VLLRTRSNYGISKAGKVLITSVTAGPGTRGRIDGGADQKALGPHLEPEEL
jgi:hypothetical protein